MWPTSRHVIVQTDLSIVLGRTTSKTSYLVLLTLGVDGNALLAGLPYTTIASLQCVVNAAVRLVYGLRSRDHVSAATTELHWLPVEVRIQFKLCLLVHLTLIGKAPTYVTDLLQPVLSVLTLSSCSTVLCSATRSDFLVPRMRLKCILKFLVWLLPRPETTCHCTSKQSRTLTLSSRDLKLFYSVNFTI